MEKAAQAALQRWGRIDALLANAGVCFEKSLDDLALFLASKESDYITGQGIVIDGGQTLPESHFLPY